MVEGRPMSITSFKSASMRSQIEPLPELENGNGSHKSPPADSLKSRSNHSIISVSEWIDEKDKVIIKLTHDFFFEF